MEIKNAIETNPWLKPYFDIGENYIRTNDRRIEFTFAGLRHNLESIKSMAKIHICWLDEAETISERAYQILIPTIREEDSELWVTWNPGSDQSATHKRFRETPPNDAKIVEMNWRDNPWFPEKMNKDRLEDLEKRPDSYAHIWEGEFISYVIGAYYTTYLQDAKVAGRISNLSQDPNMTIRIYCDIGGTGAKADSFVLIAAQFIGKEIRILNHYEVQGQPIASHLNWLRENDYSPKKAQIWLPHDGVSHDKVYDVSYQSAFRQAGYSVQIIPNQGKGAAKQRVEKARQLFPNIWFNQSKTENLRKALGIYHEKINSMGVGVGPEHDESSNSADAFGYMCVSYQPPTEEKPLVYPKMSVWD
jgi:phage terminase large subunit